MNAGVPVARPGLAPSATAALTGDDRRIVITGASGWLGNATIELLHGALGYALHDRLRCFGSNARTLHLRDGLAVDQRPLAEIGSLDQRPTSVLHLAFLTKDRVEGMDADAYEAANAALSGVVLDALDPIGAEAVFVASSGAARSAEDPAADHAMRLYGALKKRDEDMFARWAIERDRTAVITRVFNVAGPYINKHQNYALAAFILDALAGREIVVKAPHRVVRGFVAIRELMSLVFCLLNAVPPAVYRFDTGGEALELGDVAAAVGSALNAPGVARAAITSERVDHYVGDPGDYDGLRSRFAIDTVPLADQIRETAESLVAASRLNG
jgi:nucleoside-diphosphate-sugar epimerase